MTEAGQQCPPSARADLRAAQQLFLATWALPTLAYYLGRERAFPATISWTIRVGWPKLLHHVLWLSGWACTARGVSEAEGQTGLGLCAAMVSVGVVAVVLAPIGRSQQQDHIHHAASLAYIILHIPWFHRWCIPFMPYQAGFYAALTLFLINIAYTRALKRARCAPGLCGIPDPQQVTSIKLRRWLQAEDATSPPPHANCRATQQLCRTIYRLELLEMVLEHAIFLFFVAGMTARSAAAA